VGVLDSLRYCGQNTLDAGSKFQIPQSLNIYLTFRFCFCLNIIVHKICVECHTRALSVQNVVLDVIVRRANLQTTGTIYNKDIDIDDIDIVGRSQSAVQNAYLALEGEAAKEGLRINEKKKKRINEQKTKYMIAARNDTTICDEGQSVAIGDKHFEVVKEFVYLRSLMTPTNDVSLEIQRRIKTANRCFFGLRQHLQSSNFSRQTKFTIHKTLIRPVLLYGSETWVLTKREENQLLVFEKKVLRK
jgi:hypothetical protein